MSNDCRGFGDECNKVEASKSGVKRRGFGSMDPAKHRAIASRGGKSAHAQGKAHQYTSEEARLAGLKGGLKVSADKEHMAEIGRKGGQSRALNVANAANAQKLK